MPLFPLLRSLTRSDSGKRGKTRRRARSSGHLWERLEDKCLLSGDLVQTLSPASVTAAQFSTEFTPLTSALSSLYSFLNQGTPGTVISQVFRGIGAYAGTYAYAYQLDANSAQTDTGSPPGAVGTASIVFNATPINSFVVTGGGIGGIPATQSDQLN